MAMPNRTAKVNFQDVDKSQMTPHLADLYRHWLGLKTGNRLPSWGSGRGGDFHLKELSSDVLPLLIVVDVIPETNDYLCRYWGSERSRFLKMPDMTGKTVQEGAPQFTRSGILAQYGEVLETAKPILLVSEHILTSGLVAQCQTLRLPLSTDGIIVDKIVSGTEFQHHEQEFIDEAIEAL